MSDPGTVTSSHDDRLDVSHKRREMLQMLIFTISLALVTVIIAMIVVAAAWPSHAPCLPGAKDCVTIPNWGQQFIAEITSAKDLLFDLLTITIGGGGSILYGRGAFDAYIGKKSASQ